MALNVRQLKELIKVVDASSLTCVEIDTAEEKITISKTAPGTDPQTQQGDETHDA
ncbi:hypothetical protein [Trichloromonas sp.]|uniref:hypothetical protein n=1 Tax=Trichloromonas sp. TaxID=3069249 RepID=UPI002A383582|nr:hypothetical protein [Trichloromonas sp.]